MRSRWHPLSWTQDTHEPAIFRDGLSEGCDGEETRAYQGKNAPSCSTRRRTSINAHAGSSTSGYGNIANRIVINETDYLRMLHDSQPQLYCKNHGHQLDFKNDCLFHGKTQILWSISNGSDFLMCGKQAMHENADCPC